MLGGWVFSVVYHVGPLAWASLLRVTRVGPRRKLTRKFRCACLCLRLHLSVCLRLRLCACVCVCVYAASWCKACFVCVVVIAFVLRAFARRCRARTHLHGGDRCRGGRPAQWSSSCCPDIH